MFDLGWSEMLLIGIVALIVVGPKELPGLFRTIGQFVGKARGMAREFSRAMESAADETGLKDIDRTIRAATRPVQYGTDRLREAAGLSSSSTGAGKPPGSGATPAAPATPATPRGPATQALAEKRAGEQAALKLTDPVAPAAAPAAAAPTPDAAPSPAAATPSGTA